MVAADKGVAASVADMAALVDRGQRSAIGAYGFGQGGLIIEGGKCEPARLSTLLMRYPFCDDWRIVLICPQRLQGVWGQSERDAFDHMPPISDQATSSISRSHNVTEKSLATTVLDRK